MIFRYCKRKYFNDLENKKVQFNEKLLFLNNSNGMITFNEQINNNIDILKNHFDIYIGIVSGLDEVFKNEVLGNINVICDENKIQKFILIEKYPLKIIKLMKFQKKIK